MPVEFRLPDVGEGISEGEVVRWLVDAGDAVEEDQPVAEVETDKALVEIPAPVDGTVTELRAEEGEVVPVGDVIIVFEPADEVDEAELEAVEAGAGGDAAAGEDGDGAPERTFAPPRVRRLARERGVDLAAVEGSGPGGRVTEADVRAAADGEDQEEADAAPEATQAEPTPEPVTDAEGAERDRTLAAPATRRVARELDVDIDAVPAVEERDGGAFVTEDAVREYAEAQRGAQGTDAEAVAAGGDREDREERVPYRGVRRTIGERMAESASTAPHATHHDTAVVEGLVEARERLQPRAEERDVRLTYLPFVLKAAVAALREYPYMNATLDEAAEEIVLKDYYNVGVAVATDHGLMVPVVEDVDEKGVLEVAAKVRELAENARDRSIAPEDLRGSTFTVTNFGAIGGEYATPIINYPEVAILGLGALERRPVVEDGEVVARHTLPLSLSIDHRVVDGAVAAEFANALMEYLKDPALLLLE